MNCHKQILFFCALLFTVSVSSEVIILPDETGVHKWIDEKGKAHFSKTDFAKSKAKKSKSAQQSVGDSTENPLLKPKKPQVEVYYASWDPQSELALQFFRDKHILVTAYDVESDPEAATRKRNLAPDYKGLPLVVINGLVIRGVNEEHFNQALIQRYELPPEK
jgi:hypothetical protein